MELSKFTKLRIAIQVIESIKQLSNKSVFYQREEDDLNTKIAKKAGINITSYGSEAGLVNIDEYITLTRDEYEMKVYNKLHSIKPRKGGHHVDRLPKFEVDEKLKQLVIDFEKNNIPESGPCKTLIGEMFRAMQRIQYRAFNDGDLWFEIGSESFMSYMFLISQIDLLNWSNYSYNEEDGRYSFEFTDSYLNENSWDGKISEMIEDRLARDAEFIKYQLMDLLSNGKIKDVENKYDSRDFSLLKKE